MSAHWRWPSASRQRLTIGISDHVAGPELPALIARMNAQDPQLLIDIRIASSGPLLQGFDRREYDTVIVRTHAGRDDGELLAEEPFGWFAAPGWQHRAGEPLPLATLAEPCGVRAMAGQLLDRRACRGPRCSWAAAWPLSRPPSWRGWAWRAGAAHAGPGRRGRGPAPGPAHAAAPAVLLHTRVRRPAARGAGCAGRRLQVRRAWLAANNRPGMARSRLCLRGNGR
jgi:DNA-binding transcriptional LysR family regulator